MGVFSKNSYPLSNNSNQYNLFVFALFASDFEQFFLNEPKKLLGRNGDEKSTKHSTHLVHSRYVEQR